MYLEMSDQYPDITKASSEEPSLPLVNISVTADIRFNHYHASVSSDDTKNPKVTLNTSPYAIFEEQNSKTDICTKSKSRLVAETSLSEECDLQPIVRRSKKSTRLNCNMKDKDYIKNKRNIINRTVILPYFGCSKKDNLRKTFDKNTTIFVKSSKSWEKVIDTTNSVKKDALFRSKSLHKSATIKPFQQLSDNEIFEELLSYPFRKSNPLTPNCSIVKQPAMRSFYHVEDLKSGSQILFDDKTRIKYLCTPIINNSQNPYKDASKIIHSTNNSFGKEMLKPTSPRNLLPKQTRNVSILHRPHMRNQATSTSSLNILNNDRQGHEDSIKGMIKPYIADEKTFPSELILKLVPKKEALEKNKINEDATSKKNQKMKSAHSSETDLLAPMLTTQSKPKKRKGNGLFSWFSKSKKKKVENNSFINGSDENLRKEVYYPSAVEVHHNK